MISTKWLSVAAAGVLTLGLVACGNGDGGTNGSEPGANGGLSGSVELDGSSTVGPISEVAAELFMRDNNGVQVTVGVSGTGGGFERFCRGETDISNASRPIRDDEAALCASNGVEYEQITVANDALSVLVHLDNPVDCLTVEQLQAIWAPGSTINNWSQIPGLDVDFDQPLELYGPGTTSGTFDFFTEEVMGEQGASRDDYNDIGEDDATGMVGVQGTLGALFYVGFTHYLENQDTVKALQIDSDNGCVEPSGDTVRDGSYTPLGRGLYIFPSASALARSEVMAFVEYYLDNNDQIAGAVGAIPLTDAQRSEMLTLVAGLVS